MHLNIRHRLPGIRQLTPVYGLIVLFVYSWTILWFFWKLNSWLRYLTTVEIATILAYGLMINLLESLVVLTIPLVLSLALPARWFFDQFIARSTALLVPLLGFLVFAAFQFEGRANFHQSLIMRVSIPVLFLAIGLIFSVGRWSKFRMIMEALAERTTVFLYITLPLSLLSLTIVLVRNLL